MAITEIADPKSWETDVLNSEKPVFVDFWAQWCGPCRMVGPVIDELSEDFEGKAIIGKLDVDSNQIYAAKFGVRNIPTVLLFKDGEMISRQVGVAPKQTYEDAINSDSNLPIGAKNRSGPPRFPLLCCSSVTLAITNPPEPLSFFNRSSALMFSSINYII